MAGGKIWREKHLHLHPLAQVGHQLAQEAYELVGAAQVARHRLLQNVARQRRVGGELLVGGKSA